MDQGNPKTEGESPHVTYQRFLAEGRICLQRCELCGVAIFPPRTICPRCGGQALDWQESSGAGMVYSTTTVRQKPERGGDYNIALVDLDEGVRMLSSVEDCPDGVAIGAAVTARIRTNDKGVHLVRFVADGENNA